MRCVACSPSDILVDVESRSVVYFLSCCVRPHAMQLGFVRNGSAAKPSCAREANVSERRSSLTANRTTACHSFASKG